MNMDTRKVHSFVSKLQVMMEESEENERKGISEANSVSWNGEGTSIIITDGSLFIKDILPRIFKNGNFTTFVRQLNL